MKKIISLTLAGVMAIAMSVSSFASSNDIQMHLSEQAPVENAASDGDGVATPNAPFEPQIDSRGRFTISFSSNQELPVYVDSDTFTITATSCRINMDVENLLPGEPLNDDNVYLTLYGPGCGLFGKRISYKIDGGNLGYTFTGLTSGAEYHFDVEMWDWVDITGSITNFGEVV